MNRIETTLKALIFALSLTALGGLIGCEGAPEAGGQEEATAGALLKGGGGASAGFTCDDGANTCTCTGDEDCNDMFGSGLCGGQASCDTSNPLRPICTCTQARTVTPTVKVGTVKVGQVTVLSRR
jgi:hypothetical protein